MILYSYSLNPRVYFWMSLVKVGRHAWGAGRSGRGLEWGEGTAAATLSNFSSERRLLLSAWRNQSCEFWGKWLTLTYNRLQPWQRRKKFAKSRKLASVARAQTAAKLLSPNLIRRTNWPSTMRGMLTGQGRSVFKMWQICLVLYVSWWSFLSVTKCCLWGSCYRMDTKIL